MEFTVRPTLFDSDMQGYLIRSGWKKAINDQGSDVARVPAPIAGQRENRHGDAADVAALRAHVDRAARTFGTRRTHPLQERRHVAPGEVVREVAHEPADA